MKILELKIKGMTCGGCSASVEGLVDQLRGIEARNIDHENNLGKIEFDESIINEEEIIKKINEGHYKVVGRENIVDKKAMIIPSCPICNQRGDKVPNTVFKSNLRKEDYSKIDMNKKNYICLNPDCDVAYYNDELTIDKSALKRELWYKKGVNRKIICYCNNIDDKQIKHAVEDHDLTIWEDIMSHYREKVNEKCEVLNPTGYCCRDLVSEVVTEIKKEQN